MKKVLLILSAVMLLLPITMHADEGMWIPMLLGKNEAAMQKAGMRITAKDIYDVNNACLKDAVILFNQGCTGEFVSNEGLFLTNHHCGYYYITSHSTVEHDYLTHGFWAMNRDEELPCPGLTATRLVRMEDVTDQVLHGVTPNTSETERQQLVERNIASITAKAVEGTHYKAVIKPFYYGNQYFMYINEVFTDVRLVGAPPSNIGKFGGDTDNWMWPRHTGDFSMFRVYADANNQPAPYAKTNRPYQPLKHLEISLQGVDEDDFTFVFGYPGTTRRYVTADAVNLTANEENPIRIALRDIRLRHYNNAMNQSPAQRLKYASKVASIANGWKKWQGETLGINRLHAVTLKQEQEAQFNTWAANKPAYRHVLDSLHNNYQQLRPVDLAVTYFSEAVLSSDFMNRAASLVSIYRAGATNNEAASQKAIDALLRSNATYFNDFTQHSPIDSAIFVETMVYMWQAGYAPYLEGKTATEVARYLSTIYTKSMLTRPGAVEKFFKGYNTNKCNKLLKDPAVALYLTAYNYCLSDDKRNTYITANQNISRLMRTYVKGLMEQYPDSNFFPDANLTLRVAYGHVKGFHPRDAVTYTCYSTLEGIMQKEDPNIYDYVVEDRLKALYKAKDYGRYANARGEMPVAFIATNHTTGGNSGSPVLNADGRLVGINFDRCWEGTMSDLLFDPDYCRNISLDIRYCLFIIDKFAGASHLIDELTIVE